jgi:hypothetical protein
METETMTHAEQIFKAAVVVCRRNKGIFTREQVRRQIGVSQEKWESGYTAIFQGMRNDHPGGVPDPGSIFRNVFHPVERGKYQLNKDGAGFALDFSKGDADV